MQAQASIGIWDFLLFWIFTGSGLLGLPPGERDPLLLKSVPPKTLVYFEWAARGPGQAGASGIDGFVADPEIQEFSARLDAALRQIDAVGTEPQRQSRREMLLLTKLLTAHPGCVFAGFEPIPAERPGLANWLAMLRGVHGGVVFTTGDDTNEIWQRLNRVLTTLPNYQFDEASATQSIPLSIPGYKLVLHREPTRILFAIGEGTLPRMIDGLGGKLPGLDSNTRFRQALDRVSVPRVSTIGWIDGQGILAGTSAAMGPLGMLMRPVFSLLRLDALDHVVHMSGVDQDAMIRRSFIANGGTTDGIMVVFAGAPLQPAHFAHIPSDSDLVIVGSVNLKGLYLEIRKMLVTAQPLAVRVFDEAVRRVEAELGMKIVDDVLPAFGDVVTAFDSPAAGGILATSLVGTLEVRDPAKAVFVFERSMQLLDRSTQANQENERSVTLRQQAFLGHQIYYLHSQNGDSGETHGVTPTFCLTDRHLLFSVHPQAMKAHLRNLQFNRPPFNPQASNRPQLPTGDAVFYASLSGNRLHSVANALLPFGGQTVIRGIDGPGVQMDQFHIPSAAAVLPYFGDLTVSLVRQRDGLLSESRNLPPMTALLAILSAHEALRKEDLESSDAARQQASSDGVQLGPVDGTPAGTGVVPAAAATPPKPAPTAFQSLAPLLLKSLIPDDIRPLIPETAIRQLEEGPTPEMIQRREDARKKRDERRRRRMGIAP